MRDEPFAAGVHELCELFAGAGVQNIVAPSEYRGGLDDPLLHFYERFLAAYDPALRGLRGVYCTPQPVVRFIVRAVGDVLADAFGITPGGRGGEVVVLDPACGTAAFLHEYAGAVRARFIERDDPVAWRSYVRDVLLPGLAGFEILLVPFVVAHLKLVLTLRGADLAGRTRERFGYELGPQDRLRVTLANALEAG
ncbi:MAG TPA: N-6 DNA methylase, partial [Candidatus Elarobacter sp.]